MTARPRARRRAGRWAPLLGLLLALCLSAVALIGVLSSSVAAAKRDHVPQHSQPASEPAGQETTGGAVATEPGATSKGRGKARREKAATGTPPEGSQAPALGKARHHAEAKARRQAAKSDEGSSQPEAQAGGSASAIAPAARSGKRHREIERERRRERRQARKDEKEAGREGEQSGGGGKGTPAPQPVSQPAAMATSAPATSAPATTGLTTAIGTTGPLPSVLGASGARSSAAAGARHARRAGRRAARVSPTAARTRPVSALPAAATVTPSADGATGQAGNTAATAGPRSGSSPLVRTVTRFIDVVPALIRFVIAALLALALALALSTRFASRRAERLARQRRELLEDVGLLQAALLPELPERIGAIGTTAAYRPASGPAAGGDFYDLFALADGRLAVLVGDVSGHGRSALPHTTLLRFTLRAYLEVGMTPREALQAAAPGLERQLGESFATVVLAIYDPHERTLVYSCAGHPPPLLAGAGSPRPITACSAPPIGVGWPTGTRQTVISIPGGGRACFYTDGVIEAKLAGELFGVERLRGVLAALPGEDGAGELLERVAAATDAQADDMAACLLDVEGEHRPASVLAEEVEVRRRELTDGRLKRFLAAGGLAEAEIEDAITQAAGAVLRDGSVVLRLRGGEGPPRVELAHNDVARMRITARSAAGASEVAV